MVGPQGLFSFPLDLYSVILIERERERERDREREREREMKSNIKIISNLKNNKKEVLAK